MINWSEVEHFEKVEWKQDPDKVHGDLVHGLDKLRELLRVKVHIHEAYAKDGHYHPKSLHYNDPALAVDFHCGRKQDGFYYTNIALFVAIQQIGTFTGVGFYPHWNPVAGWHVDLRKEPLFWYRSENGRYFYGFEALTSALRRHI